MFWSFQALLEYLEKMASKFDEGDIQCPQVAMENEFFASQHNWPHCTLHSEKLLYYIQKVDNIRRYAPIIGLFWIFVWYLVANMETALAMAGTAPWNRRRNFQNQQPLGVEKRMFLGSELQMLATTCYQFSKLSEFIVPKLYLIVIILIWTMSGFMWLLHFNLISLILGYCVPLLMLPGEGQWHFAGRILEAFLTRWDLRP